MMLKQQGRGNLVDDTRSVATVWEAEDTRRIIAAVNATRDVPVAILEFFADRPVIIFEVLGEEFQNATGSRKPSRLEKIRTYLNRHCEHGSACFDDALEALKEDA